MIVCPECGREPQAADGGRSLETHWLGCSRRLRAHARNLVEASQPARSVTAPPPPAPAAPKRRGRPPKKRVSE